jgi:hypothetical protein
MKLLKNVLVVIAATGAMGSVQAQIAGDVFELGTLTDTGVKTTTRVFASGSFLDTFNFTIGAASRFFSGDTVGTNIADLKMQLYDSGGKLLYTGLKVRTDLDPGDFYAKISGKVVSDPGTYSFSVSATPEPAEWMLLLCGLLLAGFVARRKIGFMAGAPVPA